MLVTAGEAARTGEALQIVLREAAAASVDLLAATDEHDKHGAALSGVGLWDESMDADMGLVLGGDGTMLRAIRQLHGIPVIGVNFGRVGFLTSIEAHELAEQMPRVFTGDIVFSQLPMIDAVTRGQHEVAVNDVVVTSEVKGRMAVLEWSIDGVDMGERGCDGVVCATPAGSTGYNLSAGGPVLSWGVEAMVVTFVAPHALDARPLVLAPGDVLRVTSRSRGFDSQLVVDGHVVATIREGSTVEISLGQATAVLASLPERPFLARYRDTFSR